MMAARYRVLLVDDEALARRRLRQLLSAAPDFDVVGECDDARRAEEQVRALRPDLVFLDIRMPHLDGFGVRAALRDRVRHVVFVTAHPEHAAKAFDVAAADYLVKPVTQARFNATLDRLRRTVTGPGDAERVLLGGRQGGTAVSVADIVRLEAKGAYVAVHAKGQRHLLRESMAQVLDRLGPERFVRIHRSAAVQLSHVSALKRTPGLTVELSDGTRLPVSRRKAAEVVELLRGAGGKPLTTPTDR